MSELRDSGLGFTYLRCLKSHLAPRTGNVCVGGKKSFDFVLADQVFQITVLAPPIMACIFQRRGLLYRGSHARQFICRRPQRF